MKTHVVKLATKTLILLVTLLVSSVAFAQHEGKGQGYVFGSAGESYYSTGVKVGAGVGFERLFYKGIAGGADIQGYGANGNGGLLLTANGSYHFRNLGTRGKLVPFATAGYSGLAACSWGGCGGISGVNFGGGVNYWFKPNRGLRLEVRDHVYQDYAKPLHMGEFRVGFAF